MAYQVSVRWKSGKVTRRHNAADKQFERGSQNGTIIFSI
ncbi:hypothetical protein NT04LS_1454 [Listeria seeligeri FSL S4-171]|nr:hypothetical protein NT04LS_1454 [Listeria seeligeri FSL S4-171]